MECLLENGELNDANTEVIEENDCWRDCFGSIGVEKMTHDAGVIAVFGEIFSFKKHDRCELIDSYS